MNTLEIILVCLFAVAFLIIPIFVFTKKKHNKSNDAFHKNNKFIDFLNRKTNNFTNFEKIWLFGLIAIAVVLAIVLPEESVNGIDGRLITILYLMDITFAMLCELLITKQSKWNAIIYLLVEAIEFTTLLLLRARFASLAIILVFWVPMHILTFVNWHKHPDKKEKELTVVRQLNWWKALILFAVTALWTVGIGYLMAAYGPDTEFFASDTTMKIVAYLDACFSILGMIDGILVWLRFKEAIGVWTIATIIESVINIITGQWILLILKVGYLTNDIYGLFKWTNYIKKNEETNSDEQADNPALTE